MYHKTRVCRKCGHHQFYRYGWVKQVLAEIYEDEHQLTDEYIHDAEPEGEHVVSYWYQCAKCGTWYNDEMHLLSAPLMLTIANQDAHRKETTMFHKGYDTGWSDAQNECYTPSPYENTVNAHWVLWYKAGYDAGHQAYFTHAGCASPKNEV